MIKIRDGVWRVTTAELDVIRATKVIDGIQITQNNQLIASQVSAGIWEVWFKNVPKQHQ